MQWLRFNFLVLVISCAVKPVLSQSVPTLIGGRAAGMAYASVPLTDQWSLFNNIAGAAGINQPSIVAAYDVRSQLQSADRTAFALLLPMKIGTFSTGVFRFGDDIYSEQKLSVGYANQLGLAALGISLNYIQYRAAQFGTKAVVTVNFGGIAKLTKQLSIGVHIQNMNQPVISETTKERVPTLLAAGMSFTPSDKVLLVTEVQKDLDNDATYKVGLEYKPVKKFAARTGFNLKPSNLFFGIGFSGTRLSIDYAYQHSPAGLANSHQASVAYKLKKK